MTQLGRCRAHLPAPSGLPYLPSLSGSQLSSYIPLSNGRFYSFTHCYCNTGLLCVVFSFHTRNKVSERECEVYKYKHVHIITAYKDCKDKDCYHLSCLIISIFFLQMPLELKFVELKLCLLILKQALYWFSFLHRKPLLLLCTYVPAGGQQVFPKEELDGFSFNFFTWNAWWKSAVKCSEGKETEKIDS